MNKLKYIILLVSISGFSQILEPVKWSTKLEKISALEYDVVFTAEIDKGWHLYSQHVPENGPLPTVFKFENLTNYLLVGSISEPMGQVVYEAVFDMKIKYFETKAIFKQRIKLKGGQKLKVSGNIEFMSCNSEKCVPGYDDFEIEL